MNSYLVDQLYALKQNLVSGVLLAFFRRSAFSRFQISLDQAAFLIFFNFSLSLVVSYIKYLPDPNFNVYGISGFGMDIFGLLITAFILTKFAKDNRLALDFVVLISSLTPFYIILNAILFPYLSSQILYYCLIGWAMAAVIFTIARFLDRHVGNTLVIVGSYGFFVVSPALLIANGEMWYPRTEPDQYYEKYNSINQEQLFYDQFDYLLGIERNLLPGRRNVTDLYFLGFGSFATENVFMKEIQYLQNLMDNEFDTKGRSVALINNPATLKEVPLATLSNLNRVLVSLGQAMDKEEDVLFVYLTSHGSRKHELSVSFWPLVLNQVTPMDLRLALDDAGIKWRIILVSACYSGGFLEPLKDDYTIIMTASAKDRTSFGCGTQSDFTYFGRAVLIDEMANSHSFINAFENAIDRIDVREKQKKLTASLPQLSIGNNIRPKVIQLERELNAHYQRSTTYSGM